MAKEAEKKVESKREKTERILSNRVNRAMYQIHIVGNCANRQYEFTADEVDSIETALQAELDSVIDKFRDCLKGGNGKKAFTFTLNGND